MALFAAEYAITQAILTGLIGRNSVLGLILNTHDRSLLGVTAIFLSLSIDLGLLIGAIGGLPFGAAEGMRVFALACAFVFAGKSIAVYFLLSWAARIVITETTHKERFHALLVVRASPGNLVYRAVQLAQVQSWLKDTVQFNDRVLFGAIGIFMLFCSFSLWGLK